VSVTVTTNTISTTLRVSASLTPDVWEWDDW